MKRNLYVIAIAALVMSMAENVNAVDATDKQATDTQSNTSENIVFPVQKQNSAEENLIQSNKYLVEKVEEDGTKIYRLNSEKLGLPSLAVNKEHCKPDKAPPGITSRPDTDQACIDFRGGLQAATYVLQHHDQREPHSKWKQRFKPAFKQLSSAAVEGESVAAVFQAGYYVWPPFEDQTEGLAWYMVAYAMGDHIGFRNDGNEKFLFEPEQTYVAAIKRAKYLIKHYHFKVQL